MPDEPPCLWRNLTGLFAACYKFVASKVPELVVSRFWWNETNHQQMSAWNIACQQTNKQTTQKPTFFAVDLLFFLTFQVACHWFVNPAASLMQAIYVACNILEKQFHCKDTSLVCVWIVRQIVHNLFTMLCPVVCRFLFNVCQISFPTACFLLVLNGFFNFVPVPIYSLLSIIREV